MRLWIILTLHLIRRDWLSYLVVVAVSVNALFFLPWWAGTLLLTFEFAVIQAAVLLNWPHYSRHMPSIWPLLALSDAALDRHISNYEMARMNEDMGENYWELQDVQL